MAESNIEKYETSQQDGTPLECYNFSYNGVSYNYTSKASDVELVFTDGTVRTEKYFADYISRKSIKPSSSGSSTATVITVDKDNNIAKLYQGPPPEKPVFVKIYRLHEQDTSKVDVVFYGRVSQASFRDSECDITVKLENYLSKELPTGMNQYTCNNVIYDEDCQLDKSKYKVDIFIDKVEGLSIYSTSFAEYPDGYFEGGFFYFSDYVRMISEHKGNMIKVKYPFIVTPRNNVAIYPGCDGLFKTCAKKFNNTLNFAGCPYIPPTDSEKNPVGKGVYWVDSLVIQRDTNGYVGTIGM